MKALRMSATLLVALLIAGFGVFMLAPAADAQDHFLRPFSTLDHNEACPAGTTVQWSVPGGVQYCTAPADYAPISNEADCTEAGAVLGGFALWVGDAGVCMGGGLFPDATAADCTGTLFVSDVMIGSFAEASACVIQLYRFAPAPIVGPIGDAPAASASAVDGMVTVVIPAETVALLDLTLPVEVGYNPVVYTGLLPATGVVPPFEFPADRESIEVSFRADMLDGNTYIETFSFARPAVTPIPPTSGVSAPSRATIELSLTVTDPYTCGGGFSGTIVDGTAPFHISYGVHNAASAFSLATFTASDAEFSTPDGYLPYAIIPDAAYSLNIRITDSSYPIKTLALEGFAKADIRENCGDAVAVSSAPSTAAQPSALAVTGPVSDKAFPFSQAALGLGLSLLATARLVTTRRRETDSELTP